MNKRICAITMVRNDATFIHKWVAHYGGAFGRKNLFILLDGHDQEIPPSMDDVNFIRLPHLGSQVVAGDRRRARVLSKIAAGLHFHFDIVIGSDIDEFVVVDPQLGFGLAEYLSNRPKSASLSPLGLDVGQHVTQETRADFSVPLLSQRKYAMVSSRYTKSCITMQPLTWGAGLHRIKGRNFHIDPNLFLFHFGMVDQKQAEDRQTDEGLMRAGWGAHMKRRENLLKIIETAEPIDGDAYFAKARRLQTWRRPIYALNKPGMIPGNPVVIIPERFRESV